MEGYSIRIVKNQIFTSLKIFEGAVIVERLIRQYESRLKRVYDAADRYGQKDNEHYYFLSIELGWT